MSPSIVIAHDYLTQQGGAERVALELASLLGAESIVTSVYAPSRTFAGFARFDVGQSFLRRIPFFATDPRRALPLLAAAWSRMPPIAADVVVCSSSGWAHGVPTRAGTRKVVYCHNPARWLYQPQDYLTEQPLPVRLALAALRPFLIGWDRRAARSADLYLANSRSVADRVRAAYGIEPRVLHPPVAIDTEGEARQPSGVDDGGFFLTIGRRRGYKGTGLLIDAFRDLPDERLVIVGTEPGAGLPPNVIALGRRDDAELRWLYREARALVSVSREDFGLTPIEANAFGTPALVLRAGGFLDSTHEGVSGAFIEGETRADVVAAVRGFPREWDPVAIRAHAQRFSREAFAAGLRLAVDEVTGVETRRSGVTA